MTSWSNQRFHRMYHSSVLIWAIILPGYAKCWYFICCCCDLLESAQPQTANLDHNPNTCTCLTYKGISACVRSCVFINTSGPRCIQQEQNLLKAQHTVVSSHLILHLTAGCFLNYVTVTCLSVIWLGKSQHMDTPVTNPCGGHNNNMDVVTSIGLLKYVHCTEMSKSCTFQIFTAPDWCDK